MLLTTFAWLPTAAVSQPPEINSRELIVHFANPHDAESLDGRQLGLGMVLTTYDSRAEAALAYSRFQHQSNVISVEENRFVQLAWAPVDEADYEQQREWVEQINLPTAWNITTGSQMIIVATIDSGASPTHPDLQDRLVPGYNAVDGSTNTADVDGHGTHIAGIIAANGSNGVGTAGAAMDVRVMPIQVVEQNRGISNASIAAGVNWAVDHGADVINISIGDSHASTVVHSAIIHAHELGIPVISSSGNYPNTISYPASHPEVISVASLDNEGNKSGFSSVISKVDVAAPGENIFSPAWNSTDGDHWSTKINATRNVTGTSFSAAIVSGLVALVRSVNVNLSPDEIKAVLTSTATDSGDPGNEAGVGAGQVDAEAALRATAFVAMHNTWYPADFPVASGQISRTWLWGVDPPTYYAYETYDEAQHDTRLVYYYDKSRMEITDPLGDPSAVWYVTNGLLVVELISGELQTGDDRFEEHQPAAVNIAGDPDDSLGPTYATFENVLNAPPLPEGLAISQTISRTGEVGDDSHYAVHNVTSTHLEPVTNHRVASVFWDYLNSTGPIAQGEILIDGQLFDPWFYATGLPITEPYWAQVKVADVIQDVLIQCFERRCLTYTPANAEGWQVEMGNVGMHYHTWRYDEDDGNGGEPPEPPTGYPDEGITFYQTDFNDWPSEVFEEGTSFPANGGYHIRVTEQDSFIPQLASDVDVKDFSASVTIQSISGISFSQGCLAYRVAEEFTKNYAFCLAGNGEATAFYEQEDGNGGTEVTPLIAPQLVVSPEAVLGGVSLKVIAKGNEMWFFVDDVNIGVASHEGPDFGSVGVYVHNINGGTAEFKFLDLVLRFVS